MLRQLLLACHRQASSSFPCITKKCLRYIGRFSSSSAIT
jgi:hypothetical protein